VTLTISGGHTLRAPPVPQHSAGRDIHIPCCYASRCICIAHHAPSTFPGPSRKLWACIVDFWTPAGPIHVGGLFKRAPDARSTPGAFLSPTTHHPASSTPPGVSREPMSRSSVIGVEVIRQNCCHRASARCPCQASAARRRWRWWANTRGGPSMANLSVSQGLSWQHLHSRGRSLGC
jgi:hypothetical protein